MPRIKRRARNRALFRQVNETIAGVSAGFDVETQAFVCECARTGCVAMMSVPVGAYMRVRDDEGLFIVLRGHEDTVHERVIEDLGEYLIVRAVSEETPDVAVLAPG